MALIEAPTEAPTETLAGPGATGPETPPTGPEDDDGWSWTTAVPQTE
ncbi:hypothetical protein LO771_23110 [Streptacidiphilus sp. ASG 303]|nr:hypothetical protein [Streptacidiphilus sp. ASG 303]MCD0485193.1 hypothetical protein [Streptacidiphilus sp. ASG 303]